MQGTLSTGTIKFHPVLHKLNPSIIFFPRFWTTVYYYYYFDFILLLVAPIFLHQQLLQSDLNNIMENSKNYDALKMKLQIR